MADLSKSNPGPEIDRRGAAPDLTCPGCLLLLRALFPPSARISLTLRHCSSSGWRCSVLQSRVKLSRMRALRPESATLRLCFIYTLCLLVYNHSLIQEQTLLHAWNCVYVFSLCVLSCTSSHFCNNCCIITLLMLTE